MITNNATVYSDGTQKSLVYDVTLETEQMPAALKRRRFSAQTSHGSESIAGLGRRAPLFHDFQLPKNLSCRHASASTIFVQKPG